jgi:branched-chain amino acid aminotransferase
MVEATYKLPKVADAGFLCGTAAEIVALDSLNNVPFKLTWTESVSSKIQKAYRHLVLKENYSYLKSDPQYV